MRAYIRKIQLKKEETRKQIFAGVMIVCMSLVGVIWIGTLGYKFGHKPTEKVADDIKPFALFGKSIKDTYGSVSASVGKISEMKKQENKKVEEEKQIEMIPVEIQ